MMTSAIVPISCARKALSNIMNEFSAIPTARKTISEGSPSLLDNVVVMTAVKSSKPRIKIIISVLMRSLLNDIS